MFLSTPKIFRAGELVGDMLFVRPIWVTGETSVSNK